MSKKGIRSRAVLRPPPSLSAGGRTRRTGIVVALFLLVLAAMWGVHFGVFGTASTGAGTAGEDAVERPLRYVGAVECATCHRREAERWRASDHALSMQEANEESVLGDFGSRRFDYGRISSTFFRRDGKFFVRTDGADGKESDFEIKYTFGADPLQQYLIELPGGRLQALSIAWDARPQESGGQRWYHLYPEERVEAGDPLHWTERSQNWNFMCAACHSTGLRKGYDRTTDTFATEWSEINVACEACHGPGSRHVEWARQPGREGSANGLVNPVHRDEVDQWRFVPGAPIARWTGASRPSGDGEICFPCHARRRQLAEPPRAGEAFLDNYAPTLLDPGAYHADGQIDGEVFEYGSFTQSKMYRAGVSCGNCHDPHSLGLKATGNALCAQCHRPEIYDQSSHHHHSPQDEGGMCVNCHMPTKDYMGVDTRRDHRFGVPQPEHTLRSGVPNACSQCHGDKPLEWAAEALDRWYGRKSGTTHFVAAIDAARRQSKGAGDLLQALSADLSQPPIARASALVLMAARPRPSVLESIRHGLTDQDPLVRAAAARAGGLFGPEGRALPVAPLLRDRVRLVRVEAARTLADLPRTMLSDVETSARDRALGELVASERAADELPESHVNLADLYIRMGRFQEAEAELLLARKLDRRFIPALVNLADLYRLTGRDEEGAEFLREAMRLDPKAPEPIFALGLQKIRRGELEQALPLFARATELQPRNPRFAEVYGIALQRQGRLGDAVGVLKKSLAHAPDDWGTLVGLALFEHQRGNRKEARMYANRLAELEPGSSQVGMLQRQIER